MTAVAKTAEQWVAFFNAPQISANVPPEIGEMLEVARGSMIYGLFYYPLLTLGAEQTYRLLDTGTRIRCGQLGLPLTVKMKKGKERPTYFSENIDALIKQGTAPHIEKIQWDAVRNLRNSSSHPEKQRLLNPADAQGGLLLATQFLNDLFK